MTSSPDESPRGTPTGVPRALDMLLDPLAHGRAHKAEYAWAMHDSLRLDEHYRTRQLPLLHTRPRPPVGPEDMQPGEFWPPVRSVVVPLPDKILDTEPLSSLMAALRASDVAPMIWFEGLRARAGKLHATLVPGVAIDAATTPTTLTRGPVEDRSLTVVIRGPWIGRYNTGRIYLPVQAGDRASAQMMSDIRSRCNAEHRPLLAGFLQLRGNVVGDRYLQLRRIIADHQSRIAIRVVIPELALTETMDDLVLRSRTVAHYSTAGEFPPSTPRTGRR